MFPAHAGMDRRLAGRVRLRRSVPRACGDGPCDEVSWLRDVKCSPRMRGWTDQAVDARSRGSVFPAHAGMDRSAAAATTPRSGVPRACGDGPSCQRLVDNWPPCSPRMRGWTGAQRRPVSARLVFPAHAGMDRPGRTSSGSRGRVPRACGDGPPDQQRDHDRVRCSPRMRGWTATSCDTTSPFSVFPAHAGMDRCRRMASCSLSCVPRACGDGPAGLGIPGRDMTCSPRMRGWTGSYVARRLPSSVFPAHAGMDRGWARSRTAAGRVPRACGDGPRACRGASSFLTCSPRMRGWTVQGAGGHAAGAVFPAHAGMDRLVRRAQVAFVRVPRACGDGPAIGLAHAAEAKCSPRMRGWTVRGSGMG